MRFKYALSAVPQAHYHLNAWSDYGFALAHLALEYSDYAAHYRQLNRPVFLDNSFHELREPLSIPELLLACEIVQPAVICAPDWIADPQRTVVATQEFAKALPADQRYAAVITGRDVDEMLQCYADHHNTPRVPDVWALPYKCPRVEFCRVLREHLRIGDPHWHLLGMHNADELRACGQGLSRAGIHAVNFDTAKALNYAMNGVPFDPLTCESGKVPRYQFDIWPRHECKNAYIRNVLALKAALADSNPDN